jgi:[pyruvate, phosphate dikinase]-phosphate phosphotransferase / [pyruvate, phosphate dikinase] kinase
VPRSVTRDVERPNDEFHLESLVMLKPATFALSLSVVVVVVSVAISSLLSLADALVFRVAPTAQRWAVGNQPRVPAARSRHAETFRLAEWDGELSDEDEELIRQIRGPLGAARERPRPKSIVILSDTTGVTAKAAVEKSLVQFNGCDERYTLNVVKSSYLLEEGIDDDGEAECENLTTQIYPFVLHEEDIASILRKGAARKNVLVVFTLSDASLRESTVRMCELSNLAYVDLLGPMFDVMTVFFDRQPLGSGAHARTTNAALRRRVLSDDYYRRIEAVEFTLKCDDGMNPKLLSQADVIILGVSRTGKTPLSVVLAQTMGLKVANVPLVLDLPPPKQLLDKRTINPKRVFVLTLDAGDLMRIRKARIERELKNSAQRSTYADRQYLLADLKNARQIALEHDFTEIDVTGRAVEETASLVRSLLNDRFGDLILG